MENKNEIQRPTVGIGVMILKDGKVLLGKRRGSHAAGEYAFPGGHLEYMESFEACARREVEEETGLKIKNLKFILLSNEKTYPPKHYVHIGFLADWQDGEPKILEPNKVDSWNWYDLDHLPSPLMEMTKKQLGCYKKGKNYFDA